MDNEISGLQDSFLARHTSDPALLFQLLFNRESSLTRLTGRSSETPEMTVNTTALPTSTTASSTLTGNSSTNLTKVHSSLPASDSRPPSPLQSAFGSVAERNSTAEYLVGVSPVTLPPCVSDYIVESLEPRSNNELALEQGIARAKAKMHRTPETAVNTAALPTSTTASSTLTGNSRTNLTKVHNSLPAPDSRTPSQLQSALGSVAQRNSTAEYLVASLVGVSPVTLPLCVSDYIVESLGSTNNSRRALEQGIARAKAKMQRVMGKGQEREQR